MNKCVRREPHGSTGLDKTRQDKHAFPNAPGREATEALRCAGTGTVHRPPSEGFSCERGGDFCRGERCGMAWRRGIGGVAESARASKGVMVEEER